VTNVHASHDQRPKRIFTGSEKPAVDAKDTKRQVVTASHPRRKAAAAKREVTRV
jgi:hypothetical protein